MGDVTLDRVERLSNALDTARLPGLEILRNKRPRNKLFLLILFAHHQHWAVGMPNH
jgi:hypothetical protein